MYQKGVQQAIAKKTKEIVKRSREFAAANNISFEDMHEEMIRNAIDALFEDNIYPVLADLKLGDVAYLRMDEESTPGLIVGINVSEIGNTYEFSKADDEKTVFASELQTEKTL